MYMYKLDNVITFNQECNVKAILKKKKIPTHVKLGVTWYTYANVIMQ